MKTQCPHCHAFFNIKPEYVGKKTTCKNCGQGFIIAEAAGPTATPQLLTDVGPATTYLPQEQPGLKAAPPVRPIEPPSPVPPAVQAMTAGYQPAPQPVPQSPPAFEPAPSYDPAPVYNQAPAFDPAPTNDPAPPYQPQAPMEFEDDNEEAPEIAAEFGGGYDGQPRAAGDFDPEGDYQPRFEAEADFGQPYQPATDPGAEDSADFQMTPPETIEPLDPGLYQAQVATGAEGYYQPQFPAEDPVGGYYGPQNPDGLTGDDDNPPEIFPLEVEAQAAAQPGGDYYGDPSQTPPPIMPLPGAAGQTAPPAARSKNRGRMVPVTLTVLAGVLALIVGAALGGRIGWVTGHKEVPRLQAELAQLRGQMNNQKTKRIADMRKERERLQEEMLRVAAISQDYPAGSIPRALATAATEEYSIADTLILQQLSALESGAKITVEAKSTAPDPELAAKLAQEMETLRAEIEKLRTEAAGMAEMPRMVASTSIATQLINLAILNRNWLIAKYGLSSPVPLQYTPTGGGAAQPPAQNKPAPPAAQPAPGSGARNSLSSPGGAPVSLASVGAGRPSPGLEEMARELNRLKAENEALLNSDANIYASAVNDLGYGHFDSASEKFSRLIKMYPASPLAAKAKEGLAEVKTRAAEKEASKNPPITISTSVVRHDGGYLKNESYVRVTFKNISDKMIKKVEFKILTFDEHGYPIPSKRQDVMKGNDLTAVMAENIPPGKSDYGMWELSEKVRSIKVRLQEVEFYDAAGWQDEDIQGWVEKEGRRFEG